MLGRFPLRVALFFFGLAARRVGDLLLALLDFGASLLIGKKTVYSNPAFPFLITNRLAAL